MRGKWSNCKEMRFVIGYLIDVDDVRYVSNVSIILLFHAIILSVLDVYGLYYTLLYHFWD